MEHKENMEDRKTPYLIAAVTVLFTIAFLLLPKQRFSENENRYLQTFPAFSFRALKEGTFTDQLLSYCSDHFPLRDRFMTIKSEAEILSGKKEVNGIYIAKDGYLIENYEKPRNTDRVIRQVGKLAGKLHETAGAGGQELPLYLMLAPTASWILRDYLPAGAPGSGVTQAETREAIETGLQSAPGIQPVHIEEALYDGAGQGQVFYRTDHHWTTFGAYCGYRAFCEKAGLSALPEDIFQKTTVSEDFRGTIWSKLDDERFPGDRIELWEAPCPGLSVRYEDTGEETGTLYNLDYLKEKDKYSLFLNNLHDLITVRNPDADTDRALALIKDSYANSLVPFLALHYKTIYIFDTRYYKKGPSSFILAHPDITEVLLLYNMNTLDNDTGIGGIY